MARLPRVTQKIFAGSAANNGVFGSAQTGAKSLSNVLATIMGLPAWATGWTAAIMGSSKFPSLEEFQSVDYVHSAQIAYLLQQGIAEYDAATEYFTKQVCLKAGTYQLYGSKTNSNLGNPLTDTANWQLLLDLSSSGGSIQSSVKNFAAGYASNTTLTLTADEITLEDASGNTAKASAVNVTINTATTGANGCDVAFAGFSTSSWAYAYVIQNAAGTVAGLLSASATAPTLPAGYTLKSGAMTPVRLDGSKNIVGFKQYGRRWQYLVGTNLTTLPAMASGANGNPSTGSYVAVATGAFVPTNAATITGAVYSGPASGTCALCVAPNNNYGPQNSTSNPPPVGFNAATASNGALNAQFEFVLESGNIYWASTSGSAVLSCLGFTVNI